VIVKEGWLPDWPDGQIATAFLDRNFKHLTIWRRAAATERHCNRGSAAVGALFFRVVAIAIRVQEFLKTRLAPLAVLLVSSNAFSAWRPEAARNLGGGWHSTVYLLRQPPPWAPNHRVLKVYKHRLDNGRFRSPTEIHRLVNENVHDNKALKAKPDFQTGGRFGNIVPDALPFSSDQVLLTFREGVTLKELPAQLQESARAQIPTVVEAARQAIAHPDDNEANFLFDPTDGKLTGWPDPGWGH
jgi:hypothetical protein